MSKQHPWGYHETDPQPPLPDPGEPHPPPPEPAPGEPGLYELKYYDFRWRIIYERVPGDKLTKRIAALVFTHSTFISARRIA